MAVTTEPAPTTETTASRAASRGENFEGRHLVIGANVFISVLMAAAIVGIIQWGAYYKNAKADLTDQGVNSLTSGTEHLIGDLKDKVRLTSMYFETDIEDEDQPKYRTKVADLLALYQSVNQSKVEVDHFNPLQDHAKREALLARVRKLDTFAKQVEPYQKLIERFRTELLGRIGEHIQGELDRILALQDATPDENDKDDLGQIQMVLDRWQREISLTTRDIDDALNDPQPRYGAAKSAVAGLCSNLARDLGSIVTFAGQRAARRPDMTPDVHAFMTGAEQRHRGLINDLEAVATDARELPVLDFENFVRQLGPTANALVVETEDDAKVVSFSDIWPPVDPNLPPSAARFQNRLFKGEEKITSAVLQLTQKEKTAVVFVRFSGPPLFFSMPVPGARPPMLAQLKELLEDTNFEVREWDLATTDDPPEIDPPPIRTIYVVLRPTQPPRQQFQQQQPPQFSDLHKQKLLAHLGDDARVIFLAGWAPGPFGSFPDPYPYNSYLNDNWGIHIADDYLVINALTGDEPGAFMLSQQSLSQSEFSRSDHLLVRDMRGQPASFPYVAPLEIAAEAPDGVSVEPLLWCERSETLWGVKDIQKYIEQARKMQGVRKEPDDLYGPFNIAAAAEKGDAKIVVISSRDCMIDAVAMAPVMALTSQGITLRKRNPGNVNLFLSALHWLNDKTEWLDVGKPAQMGTIEIEEGPKLTFIRTFVYSIWPGAVLLCGGAAWWVRRR